MPKRGVEQPSGYSIDLTEGRTPQQEVERPNARSTMPNDGLIEPTQSQTAQRWLERDGGTTPRKSL